MKQIANILLCGLALMVAVIAQGAITETFDGPLTDAQWIVVRSGDAQESVADVVDGRLHLRLNTLGTRDDTVKYLGIRTPQALDISEGVEIRYTLDWNQQENGCYLGAGLVLCPTAPEVTDPITHVTSAAAPDGEPTFLVFDDLGVPPGKNLRAFCTLKRNKLDRYLFTDGWPKNKTGRELNLIHMRLQLTPQTLRIWENDTLLTEITNLKLPFTQTYLYLRLQSHSNYPAREVYFDDFSVTPIPN